MPLRDEDILALRVGPERVGETLERAVRSGAVTAHPDGSFALPAREPGVSSFLMVRNGPRLGCDFLKGFMFGQVYAGAAVPKGCEPCYKIKALPRTLRELVALYEIAKDIACLSKWGIDLGNPHSQDVYAGYFYVTGLDGARALYPVVRKLVDENPALGTSVPLIIKRGCSNYEAALGPSDRYTFKPELQEIEAYFKARFHAQEPDDDHVAAILYGKWVPFAFQIGDDTYLDFTNGRRLHPKSVTYAPDGNASSQTKQPISEKPLATG